MIRSSRSRWLCVALLFAALGAACAPSPAAGDGTAVVEDDAKLEEDQIVIDESASVTIDDDEAEAIEPLVVESSGASSGDLVLLDASEIEVLLSGNTIIGNWVGEDYEQFFASDGTTIYRPVGGQDSFGEWRVDNETGLYESLWPPVPTWDAYEVHQEGETFFWTGQGVQLSPFTVSNGNLLQ